MTFSEISRVKKLQSLHNEYSSYYYLFGNGNPLLLNKHQQAMTIESDNIPAPTPEDEIFLQKLRKILLSSDKDPTYFDFNSLKTFCDHEKTASI